MSKSKSIRKYAATTMAVAVASSAIAPVVAGAEEQRFSDVSPQNSHYNNIMAMAEAGIITGQDGKFDPWGDIQRIQVAKMLQRALDLEVPANATEVAGAYSDVNVNKLAEQDINAIAAVTAAGVFGGSAGNFDAQGNITREQIATVLVRAYNLDEIDADKVTDLNFDKVSKTHRGSVQTLVNLGLTTDVPNFDGFGNLTRAQFASLLKRTIDQVEESVSTEVNTVKAINNTTVEVEFKDEIDDIKALDFAIDGLDVENASVKQTDATTAVLTTSPQTGGEKYTVTESGETLGSFEGISVVVPESINVTTPSVQGTIGKEVTVKAEVEVPEGDSKAGIPVTFNIINDNSNLNEKIEVEVFTNDEGVAEYSYTRYYKNNDNVTAYATDKSSVFGEGVVYWTESLSIEEITEGSTLANGSKKVYKVSSPEHADGTVNIAFEENVDVPQDKGLTSDDVWITDADGADTPHQYTTGGNRVAETTIELDEDGEATFTVTGNNASVTPIVFIDGDNNGKLERSELQDKARTVTFERAQNIEVVVESLGTKDAAAIDVEEAGSGDGGRDYKATIRNSAGELQPEGTTVHVVVTEDDLEGSVTLVDSDDNAVPVSADTPIPLEVGEDGTIEFTLIGTVGSYATPTVFNDNGDEPGELDDADAQARGEIVYFGDAVLKTSEITVRDSNGDEVTSVESGQTAFFHYQVTDQNGKPNTASTNTHRATFEVTNNGFVNSIWANGEEVRATKKGSVQVEATNGNAVLEVISPLGVSNVSVDVSSSQFTLTDGAASVSFTEAGIMPNPYTGIVTGFNNHSNGSNAIEEQIRLDDYSAVSYSDGDFKQFGANVIDKAEFERIITKALDEDKDIKVTAERDANGKFTFDILEVSDKPTDGETFEITATEVTEAEEGTEDQPAVYKSGVVADHSFSDGSTFDLEVDGNSVTVIYNAGDTAEVIAQKINDAIEAEEQANPGNAPEAEAEEVDGRVVITAKNASAADSIVIDQSNNQPMFNNGTENWVEGDPAVAGVYSYDFSGIGVPADETIDTDGDLKEGDKVVFNGITYTATDTDNYSSLNPTFDATGDLTQDLTNLVDVIQNVDSDAITPTFTLALATTTNNTDDTIVVTEEAGSETEFDADIIVVTRD